MLCLSSVCIPLAITYADAAHNHSATSSSLSLSTYSLSTSISTSSPSPTKTPTPHPTRTPTPRPTKTPTPTPTKTPTPHPTNTPTPTPTKAPTPTPHPTKTPTPVHTATPASTVTVSTVPGETVTPPVVVTQSTQRGAVPTSVPTIAPTNSPGSASQSMAQNSQENGFPLLAIITGFLGGVSLILLLVPALWYLRKLLQSMLIARQRGSRYPSRRARQGKTRTIFKLLIVGSSFLITGIIASFFLLPHPIYLVVSWVILIIICSNILNQELRSYYRAGFEQVLTTLHLKTSRMTHLRQPPATERSPDLRAITNTAAYLKELRQLFKQGRKKETGRGDQHQ